MWQPDLTVGDVAGLISGCISLLHIIIPLLLAFILVGLIRGQTLDAVTWSAVSHLLQGSWWPLLLQSDGSAGNFRGKLIRWRVFITSSLVTLATVCLIVANFLTPKPLEEVIKPSKSLRSASFVHAPDASYFGQGTLPFQTIARRCGWLKWMDCPHSIYDVPEIRNKFINATVVNSTIPAITQDPFTSVTRFGTVAGPMDIQFRGYILTSNDYVDNGAVRPLGRLEVLPSQILSTGYQLVNGLIIDSYHGGVGIRNHTAPKNLDLGATWTEDILWLVPETRCTNTNLSLHFSVNANSSVAHSGDKGWLRDDGGFSEISSQVPSPRWDDNTEWKNVGPIPQLKQSSEILAWWNNQFVAQVLNLTSATKGQVFDEQLSMFGKLSEVGALKITSIDGNFLNDMSYSDKDPKQTELEKKFHDYGIRCSGYYDDDPNVDNKPFMECGYLYSIPVPENAASGQSWRADPDSPWMQSLYTCASTTYATIREVTFAMNGSTALEALTVVGVQDKNYTDSDLPTWGVEKVDSTKYNFWDIYKFWGLVDGSTVANNPDIVATKAAKLYLPAAVRGASLGAHIFDSFAAGGAFTAAWESVYDYTASLTDIDMNSIPNYSGRSNYGLTLKWRELAAGGAAGAETVLNLIWTDLVSFTVAGTKTGFEMAAQTESKQVGNETVLGTRDVHYHQRTIVYTDFRYAIPAFLAAALFLAALFVALGILCFQPQSYKALNHYMNQTSMGRAVTQVMLAGQDGEIAVGTKASEWSRKAKFVMLPVPALGEKSEFESRAQEDEQQEGLTYLNEETKYGGRPLSPNAHRQRAEGYAVVSSDCAS